MAKLFIARAWHFIVFIFVVVVIPLNGFLAYQNETGMFSQPLGRFFNMFWFFTIQSNILVGIISYLLFMNPNRTNKIFNIFKHSALVCITITGVIYHLLLAQDMNYSGLNIFTDRFLHTIIPLAYVVGWIFFTKHGTLDWSVSFKALLFPIFWTIAVMLRGLIVNYYPYPFMDVRDLGYGQTITTMLVITIFFVVLTVIYKIIDQLLSRFLSD